MRLSPAAAATAGAAAAIAAYRRRRPSDDDLADEMALVTGVSRGLGLLIAPEPAGRRPASKSCCSPEREPGRLTVGATVRSRSKIFFLPNGRWFHRSGRPSCRRRASSGTAPGALRDLYVSGFGELAHFCPRAPCGPTR